MASPALERELPVESYTDFRSSPSVEQAGTVVVYSPETPPPLPSAVEHHQPDTPSFPLAVCPFHQQQQQQQQLVQQVQQEQQQQQALEEYQSLQILPPSPCCCGDGHVFVAPYVSFRPNDIWPSPPLGPGDIQSVHNSPAPENGLLLEYNYSPSSPSEWSVVSDVPAPDNALLLEYHNSPSSPSEWSVVSDHPMPDYFHQQQHQQQHAAEDLALSVHSRMSTPYAESFHPGSDAEMPTGMTDAMPGLSATSPFSSVGSPEGLQADTPVSMVMPKMELMDNQGSQHLSLILAAPITVEPTPAPVAACTPTPILAPSPASILASSPTSIAARTPVPTQAPLPAMLGRREEKNDEPYAKLIYRALMAQPDYTMTLQELYQWFRDNTTKAKNEKGGWQNSIRHNLSMNAAFKRRDRKRPDGPAPSTCARGSSPLAGEAKRANEWVLEDWAVRDGVQSTTRYRKSNSGRRSSRRSTRQPSLGVGRRGGQRNNNNNNSAIKALSGQRGGCAARNARVRSHMYGQQQLSLGNGYRLIESGLGSPPPNSIPDGFYSLPIAIPRIDPAAIQTPPMAHGHASADFGPADAASTDLFGLQMTGPRMGQPVAGGGSGLVPVSYMGQQDPMCLTASPVEFPYGIADVQLDYGADHARADIVDPIRRYESMVDTPRITWGLPHGM